ncbi:hypothetical protein BKG86_17015 [Mycobacteroides chelonae]|uniref:helix-turn-helix domain-containing protein n=1 Tax=Mycobacteroides chelonae TaxID=1774 RepID=UPI000911FC3F|nr:helix-turn-helix domain-containing protein [Mycobacteroides chelonae]OHU71354.1 hypothetical protein BKG86_17015 [Mycobacteroides chelonae]
MNSAIHDRVVALTRQGHTSAEIANALSIARRTVVRHRRRAGISQPVASVMSADELATARVMLDDGASYHEVGRSLGRSPGTIQRNFPGHWTQEQITAHAAVMRKFNRGKYEVKA